MNPPFEKMPFPCTCLIVPGGPFIIETGGIKWLQQFKPLPYSNTHACCSWKMTSLVDLVVQSGFSKMHVKDWRADDIKSWRTSGAEQLHSNPLLDLISAHWYLKSGGQWMGALFRAAQQQDKGQRAREKTEVPYKHQKLLYCEVGRALNRLPGEVVESPWDNQTHLDAFLCDLL